MANANRPQKKGNYPVAFFFLLRGQWKLCDISGVGMEPKKTEKENSPFPGDVRVHPPATIDDPFFLFLVFTSLAFTNKERDMGVDFHSIRMDI